MMIAKAIEWFGVALLCAAPFLIDSSTGKIMAMVGLGLLCLQAYRLRAYNLLVLNTVGIIGYCYALYF